MPEKRMPIGFKRPKKATIMAVNPYPTLKSIVIWPAGPVNSNIPAKPANPPLNARQRITKNLGLTPERRAAFGDIPESDT